MLIIDNNGMAANTRINSRRFPGIEHGKLGPVRAVVVHQTDSPTAQAMFNAYGAGGNGAHFLIDRAGTIYQTASVHSVCFHVGRRIKSKCLEVQKGACADAAAVRMLALSWAAQVAAIDAHERTKAYPDRYPVNLEALGVELVGKSLTATTFEAVTAAQSASLLWLLGELYTAFSLSGADVYRHPEVSYKNPGEAAGATW
jgi:N-acetyl-anhydromuramyl-L-alanine amidase AmpD